MNSSKLNQLTTVNIEFGNLKAGERSIPFIELRLGFQRAGTHGSAPALCLSPDQARSMGMALLAAADKAPAAGTPPPSH